SAVTAVLHFRTVVSSKQQQSHKESQREQDCGSQSGLQNPVELSGNEPYQGGTGGTAQVTCKGKQGKHCSSAFRTGFCGKAERAWPHDAYGKPAQCAAHQPQDRNRRGRIQHDYNGSGEKTQEL